MANEIQCSKQSGSVEKTHAETENKGESLMALNWTLCVIDYTGG